MRRLAAVSVLLGLLALAPLPVWSASIVGSYHDLSWINEEHVTWRDVGWQYFTDYNEVCVYCHTPHHANQAAGPLWNRASNTTVFTLYSSPTLDSAPNQPGLGSRMCFSCHDGTVAVDAILNLPPPDADDELSEVHGRMVNPPETGHGDCSWCHRGNVPEFGNFAGSYFGNSLADEHPVGIAYTSAPDLVEAPSSGVFPNGIRLVDGKVECVSCHDVHDPGVVPFLRTSNAGSSLCFTCHRK